MSDGHTNKAEATAAPCDIRINGQTYLLAPLSDADWATLDNYLRSRVIRMARESLADAAPQERKASMVEAYDIALGLTWLRDGHKILRGFDGIARFLWQGLQSRHPELTLEQLYGEILADVSCVVDALDTFNFLNADHAKKKRTVSRRPSDRNTTTASSIAS